MKKVDFIEYFRAIELEQENVLIWQGELIDVIQSHTHKTKTIEQNNQKFAFYCREFKKSKEKIKLLFLICFDSLELNFMATEFLTEFNELPNTLQKDTETALVFYTDNLDPFRELVEKYLTVLRIHAKEHTIENYKFKILESILGNTDKIISDSEIVPHNEADVRKQIYNHLIYVFPDTIREVPISKITKTFKPDFGIKTLKCAIEYKFIASESEAKKFIGGLFEDSKGYSGSEDWKIFYTVIYMNGHYYTREQIKEDFKLSEMPKNWHQPIVVYGIGERKKKKTSSGPNH